MLRRETLIYFILLSSSLHYAQSTSFNVSVHTDTPVHKVPEKFLSISLDMSTVVFSSNWNPVNFTFMTPLAKALGSAYFRVGGTRGDVYVFVPSNSTNTTNSPMVRGDQLDTIYNFSKNAGWRLIFDLNLCLRSGAKWNSSNALELINYASQRNYQLDFELGNEPEWFQHILNVTMNITQIVEGYSDLRNILNANGLYNNSMIIGPSSGSSDLLNAFLNDGGGKSINALSYHQYYLANATEEQYLSSQVMDTLKSQLTAVKNLNYTPVWLGETGSTWENSHGSVFYIAGFLWLDKLGLSALYGLDVVVRQDLIHSTNAILDDTMIPYTDYWLSFLYKKLVGQTIFNVTFSPVDPNLRLYAASAATNNGNVVYGMRLTNDTITIDFPSVTNKQVTAYILKEGEPGNLYSRLSRLNGDLIAWDAHTPGPILKGYVTNLPIQIPGYSQFFIVLNQTTNRVCPNGWYQETSNANKCIKFISETQILFAANFNCSLSGKNASLLTIENAFENSEINQQAKTIGCNYLLMGLIKNGTSWNWLNGDSNAYRNWMNGYPTNDNTKNCVTFDANKGTWLNVDCGILQCYVCQQYL